MASYGVVLQSCPAEAAGPVVQALGRAFGLKESTCVAILKSMPIVLVAKLSELEAACLQLALRSLVIAGADLDYTDQDLDALPQVDWNERPLIYKREIPVIVKECELELPGAGRLCDLLLALLRGEAPPTPSRGNRQTFREADLGEITPFSNTAISGGTPASGAQSVNGSHDELMSRMDELFPDEEGGGLLSSDAVGGVLDNIMPEEDGGPAEPPKMPGQTVVTGAAAPSGAGSSGGYSLFLAKIADENRRKKAVPLLSEILGIEEGEAEKLAKKVIIPVLKGVSKDEAESAKKRFADIGVLARVRTGA